MGGRSGIALLLALGGCREAPPPDILLLTVDTLRADHLGAWGYPRDVSPALDRLAAEGLRFEQAWAQWPKTGPSFASMLTATYPKDNGIVRRVGVPLSPRMRLLAEELSAAGYATMAVVSNGAVSSDLGYAQGFDTFIETWKLPDLERPEDGGRAEIVNREVLARLDRLAGGRPWFLWVHYLDPHFPYEAPEPWRERFVGDDWDRPGPPLPAAVGRGFGPMGDMARERILGHRRDLGYYRALYDAEIRYTDDHIARLLGALEERGLMTRTVTVVTADHGESLGEHRYYFDHGRFGFETCLHVPLILHAPGRIPAGVDAAPVELLDLAPTLLELAGLELDGGRWMQGRSLAARWEGGDAAAAPRYAHAEAGYATEGRWQKIVRDERYKLIYAPYAADQRHIGGRRQPFGLFDLAADPDETENLVDRGREEFRRLHDELRRWWVPESFDVLVDAGEDGETALSEETRRQLEALGYLP